jgi:hypothetical protein
MRGGYGDERFSNHGVLPGLSEEMRQRGYRLQRVEKGTHERPVINLRLQNGPADATILNVPVELRFGPYIRQNALNVKVILVGLRAFLMAQKYGIRRGPEFSIRAFVPNFDGDYVGPDDAYPGDAAGGIGDNQPRSREMRAILARRGAKGFRDGQLDRFGYKCAVSGCVVVDVLEAAHIRAYRINADNARRNGILLRADLHTLFDLDLIAINPRTCAVAVHASVQDAQYRQFDGRRVGSPADGFDETALRQRWNVFQERAV